MRKLAAAAWAKPVKEVKTQGNAEQTARLYERAVETSIKPVARTSAALLPDETCFPHFLAGGVHEVLNELSHVLRVGRLTLACPKQHVLLD